MFDCASVLGRLIGVETENGSSIGGVQVMKLMDGRGGGGKGEGRLRRLAMAVCFKVEVVNIGREECSGSGRGFLMLVACVGKADGSKARVLEEAS